MLAKNKYAILDKGHILEEVLKSCAPLLQEARAEFGYDTLGRERGHRGLEVGEGLYQRISEVVKL